MIEYKFIVGKPVGPSNTSTIKRLGQEMEVHKDLELLQIEDTKLRLSEKRWGAVKWVSV